MAEFAPGNIDAITREHLRRLAVGLHDALAEQEFPASQEYCPKDTGDLVGTAFLSDPYPTPDGFIVVISYGSAEAGDTGIYAVIQHEDTTLNHPNGGEAKYLEKAVIEGQGSIGRRAIAHAGTL